MINQNKNREFYMLIGLPGSGKTTWTNEKLKTGEYVVLSTDNIIERMAEEVEMTYSEIWSDAIGQATKENYANFMKAIKAGKNIIWDQTNLTPKKRKNVLSQVPSNYLKIALTFELPLDTIMERVSHRASQTGKDIPKSVLINMFDTYQRPSVYEGFDKII